MTGWARKRFWAEATVRPEGAGFGVALDARALRTPGKAVLSVPTEALARAIDRIAPVADLRSAVPEMVVCRDAPLPMVVAANGDDFKRLGLAFCL